MKAQFVEILDIPKSKLYPKDIHYNYNFPTASQDEINTKYQDFLKFAILRNPWERLYSCYKNKIESNSSTGSDFILECSPNLYIGMSFEEFVQVICKIPDSESDFHFCSQVYMLFYPDGTFPINYLCNIENLAFHLEEIKSKTGIPFTSLTKINSSRKSAYETAYSPSLIEKVRIRYQRDVQLFKYEFGKKNKAFPFGYVSSDFIENLVSPKAMLSILKEKNQEIIKEIESKNIPLLRKINQLTSRSDMLQRDYDALKGSLSWRITEPLRKIFALFQKVDSSENR